MRNSIIASSLALALSAPFAGAIAADSPHTVTGNVGFASEYLYRGIAQTRGKPALQGGFDYAHSSGLYAGVWGSNITWIGDGIAGASAGLEVDVYGGYKGTISGDLGFDVGVLTYNYPGTGKTAGGTVIDQNTTELYGALSYKWLTLKYSHTTTALFGWGKTANALDKTTGSGYLEANLAFDLGDGWGVTGHVGHQKVKGNSNASYTDYKLGVTKDLGVGVLGVAATTTNAKDSCNGVAPASASDVYCFVNNNATSAYEAGKSRLLVTFTKSF